MDATPATPAAHSTGQAAEQAAAPAAGSHAAPRIVVGGALVRDGRVLAARRSSPEAVAGRWEFPGGKAEPGETEAQALERELLEELGVRARALSRLPGAWAVRPGLELRFWAAELLAGEPRALEDHDALRWLGPDELDAVDWIDHDRDVLPHVARLLTVGDEAAAGPSTAGDAQSAG
ncbi:NUDIX domain-containing protein [Streptomyces sp. 1331.2]|uniref:NUDIX domain-containing protein n=1 Tax=Streptomyces sp. 1331.2 TaxID=1938835 RepID=UPI000BD19D52|nr:NUDIX domain-containing protein [Streptomyces sp. 1331.2]SOB82286.1 8-oxo-dGTP diphosphatase [Streptomyces sp. 1331.2]